MAHHKSALKRIRANETKRLRNKYYLKTTRTFIKKLKSATTKEEAQELYKKVSSLLDKLERTMLFIKITPPTKKPNCTR
jgi:small subunit ribosomal protein S20